MRGGTKYLIKFHDTSGRDEYEHVRNLVYETVRLQYYLIAALINIFF